MGDEARWISIKDKLPEIPCLVYWPDGRQTIFDCEDDIKYGLSCHTSIEDGHKEITPTHWMLLPEPPITD